MSQPGLSMPLLHSGSIQEHQPSRIVEFGPMPDIRISHFARQHTVYRLTFSVLLSIRGRGINMPGFIRKKFEERFANIQRREVSGFSKLIDLDFDSAVHGFSDSSIDLLHIDGSHTYHDVRNDFINWLPQNAFKRHHPVPRHTGAQT
ncbi:class I SAM-dependent methyltransferase (plasmid) [Enterobacter ludwigii]|uniref:class I SAM-dependent methyltransferase n=1 Tax=Enterobacter ludwigii TaxID=299767 RepID=UPI002B4BADC4|nr:class I SAM-dependent methyltransferase [Enterobacter ludwigii]WRM07056.1 class I SAM-dependent methyltransferase [Enterobacter ludwigii]